MVTWSWAFWGSRWSCESGCYASFTETKTWLVDNYLVVPRGGHRCNSLDLKKGRVCAGERTLICGDVVFLQVKKEGSTRHILVIETCTVLEGDTCLCRLCLIVVDRDWLRWIEVYKALNLHCVGRWRVRWPATASWKTFCPPGWHKLIMGTYQII